MNAAEVLQRTWRKVQIRVPHPASVWRRLVWRLRGGKIGEGTNLPCCLVTWPHQVKLGARCLLQPNIFFNYDHHWMPGPSIVIGDGVFIGESVEFNCRERIEVGTGALIAAGCRLIDHDHNIHLSMPEKPVYDTGAPIRIEEGAWLGANVIVLKGVTIGAKAIIGAGSVVTRSVPAGETWVGQPAKPLKSKA